MMTNKFSGIFSVQTLLWLALALALAGSLRHLAHVFATVDNNYKFGIVQAVAIDAGLFALAFMVRQRKVARRSTKILWLGLVLFTGISIYGNLAYGLLKASTMPGWMFAIKPYILAASLPVLVLFLSELLSDDRQHAQREAKKASKKAMPIATARGIKQDKIAKRRNRVEQLAAEGMQPLAILDAIGAQFSVRDVRTIKSDLRAVASNNTNGAVK